MKDGSSAAQDPNAPAAAAAAPQVSHPSGAQSAQAPIDVEVKHKS